MGERKVLNKHYPNDFDPAKIPRRLKPKNQQIKVRMMLQMSIRCSTCGTYMAMGTKLNSRKEDAAGEAYLGIRYTGSTSGAHAAPPRSPSRRTPGTRTTQWSRGQPQLRAMARG
ncbi:coiled-coil domain-containing protein 94 [Hordeum vulgare]|nr:coiled-coil domain-containing protein 94 [Hordeum vulgare]